MRVQFSFRKDNIFRKAIPTKMASEFADPRS